MAEDTQNNPQTPGSGTPEETPHQKPNEGAATPPAAPQTKKKGWVGNHTV